MDINKQLNTLSFHAECSLCGNGMNAGYVVRQGDEYYCSDTCLHTVYTQEEWDEMSEGEDNDENYYTEWEEEDLSEDLHDARNLNKY